MKYNNIYYLIILLLFWLFMNIKYNNNKNYNFLYS